MGATLTGWRALPPAPHTRKRSRAAPQTQLGGRPWGVDTRGGWSCVEMDGCIRSIQWEKQPTAECILGDLYPHRGMLTLRMAGLWCRDSVYFPTSVAHKKMPTKTLLDLYSA